MVCATEGCGLGTVGRSKYCRTHRDEAREKWQGMVQEKAHAKAEREVAFEQAWNKALDAGKVAFENARCQQVVPYNPATGERYEPIEICGFAWLKVRPATGAFAKWLVKTGKGDVSRYEGGVTCWAPVGGGSQSYDRKLAACWAMAEVIKEELGVECYADGRLD